MRHTAATVGAVYDRAHFVDSEKTLKIVAVEIAVQLENAESVTGRRDFEWAESEFRLYIRQPENLKKRQIRIAFVAAVFLLSVISSIGCGQHKFFSNPLNPRLQYLRNRINEIFVSTVTRSFLSYLKSFWRISLFSATEYWKIAQQIDFNCKKTGSVTPKLDLV